MLTKILYFSLVKDCNELRSEKAKQNRRIETKRLKQ